MSDQQTDTQELSTDPWNRQNEKSVINLVNQSTAAKIEKAYAKRPELFGLDERTLWKMLKEERKLPNATDNRLRLSFWQLYDQVQAGNARDISNTKLSAGICSPEFLVQEYFKHPEKVAWLLTPPASYTVLLQEGLQFGLEQLREILELDNFEMDREGNLKPNVKVMELKTKIVMMLDQRLNGSVVQRIEQKSLNLNVSDNQVKKLSEFNTMQEIEDALEKLRKRDRHRQREIEAQATQQAIEVKQEPIE